MELYISEEEQFEIKHDEEYAEYLTKLQQEERDKLTNNQKDGEEKKEEKKKSS